MCVVAQPIFATNGKVIFDGNIGIFPFTSQVPAQTKAKNLEKGVLKTKLIQSITKHYIREILLITPYQQL